MLKICLTVFALTLASTALAKEELYVCKALSVLELGEDGALAHTDFAKAIAMHQSEFAVDRKTGVVAGGPFATIDAKNVQILSSGTDQEAMKILWLTEAPYQHFKYLWVRSYAEGPEKPFLGVSGNVVVTGTCE